MLKICTIHDVNIKELLAVFNLSFSDYFVPFHLDEAQLRTKLDAEHIDLTFSIGAFDSGKLVGFMLHGIHDGELGKLGYNGGTGVLPSHRGNGLTGKMYEFIKPALRRENVHRVSLEVLEQNKAAQKAYTKAGFHVQRRLISYTGDILINSDVGRDVELMPLSYYDWDLMRSFWEVLPSWQNSPQVLNRLFNSNLSIGAFLHAELVAYIIFNPLAKRVQQLAVRKDYRRKGMAGYLLSVVSERQGSRISFINVDEQLTSGSYLLEKYGLKPYVTQFEMRHIC